MIMRPDFEYRTRNIRVTIGDREPKPGDDENVITGNAFCGEFVGPGQVGGESTVTCGGKFTGSHKKFIFYKKKSEILFRAFTGSVHGITENS